MARSRSRSRTRSRSQKKVKEAKGFVCPYKENAKLVKKLSKDALVKRVMKEMKISTSGTIGKRKKIELSRAGLSELQESLLKILNSKVEKTMKDKQQSKIKELLKKGIIVKRTPAEKRALKAAGYGPGSGATQLGMMNPGMMNPGMGDPSMMGNPSIMKGPNMMMNLGSNQGPIQGKGIMKMMVCKNGQCNMYAKPLVIQSGGGCGACGVLGAMISV